MAPTEISKTPPRKKRTISLRWLMVLGFGGLVALAVGLVLFMSVATNFSNTYSLLNARALLLIDTMERSIRSQTNQAERAVLALANLYEEGGLTTTDLDENKDNAQHTKLKSLMIASPVIEALLVYDTDGRRSGVFRDQEGNFNSIPYGKGEQIELAALVSINVHTEENMPVWGEPIIVDGTLFHNVGIPLMKNGKIGGMAVAAIGQSNMNTIISKLGRDNATTAFVLTSDNKVIAHSQNFGFFKGRPVIDIKDFPDLALRQFPDAEQVEEFDATQDQNMTVFESGRGLTQSGYVYITRELKGYSSSPYRLGAYFVKAEIGSEMRRIMRSIMAGLAALILAVVASVALSRRLSKPMKKIARVANDFSNLELENFTPLPPSRIREIDDQAMAMNSMYTALSEFARYVPRPLVKRLMASGVEATRSVEREITILFADIVGFTTMSEGLNANQTATLLNSHFDMLCHNIDRHNGTVDKFIGDGLMAFWGAPDADENQAANALATAIGILAALKKSNIDRAKNSLDPMRLRIGIHTGRVVVGNIGSCDRQNYTIVGDAVNVANRLEQLGKQFIDEGEAIILTTHATWEKAGKPEIMQSIGRKKIRGREGMIEIFAHNSVAASKYLQPELKNAG